MSEEKAEYSGGVDGALFNEMVDDGMDPTEAAKVMDSLVYHGLDCPACHGYGEDEYGEPCDLCNGKGEIPAKYARYINEAERRAKDSLSKATGESLKWKRMYEELRERMEDQHGRND